MTATLSVEGAHWTDSEVVVRPLTARLEGADGAEVSGHALVLTQSPLRAERFPDASTASTSTRYGELHVSPESVAFGDVEDETSRLLT